MTVGIDISPLQSGHKVRGVGFYLEYLKRSLLKYYPENKYIFFTQEEKLSQNVDLIHYPYFDPFFLTLPFSKQHKTVVTVHDLTPLIFPKHFPAGIKGNFRWQIQKFNLRRSDGIIADSIASQHDIVKIAGIPQKNVDVAYLAAGEEFERIKDKEESIKQIKNKYMLPERFVLYVGDITWNKNVSQLVKAIKEINVTLVMVGKSLAEKKFDSQNPWNKDLVEFNRLAKDDKRIMRLGFVPTEDLVALYNAAEVFVFPSLYEGFGLPVLEAMQCGCPVVTTKEGSLKEVAGEAAFFVDPYDVQSIANGIGEVFYTKKLQEKLSHQGVEQTKKFSWKKTAAETIALYKKVLS